VTVTVGQRPLTVGSLFAGIGGFDLGLERAGMRIIWQCDSDEFCRRVLARHWPDVPRYEDVRAIDAQAVPPNVLAGGFPCQDLSIAGRRAGLVGPKSGLWSEFLRAIRLLRPSYVLVENVPGLLTRGLGTVLGDLAACGYDAEWDCIPAAAIGALHLRARVWLLAYPAGGRHRAPDETVFAGRGLPQLRGRWANEPDVGRMAHGVPDGVDRRRALGNALVPQIAEWIGRRILEYEASARDR
jgi:DNA (cytosine-5)-methyltransferase 1